MGLFNDDDADREPPEEERWPSHPLSIPFAILWFFVAGMGAVLALKVTTRIRDSASFDIVNAVACQALAYVACLAVMVRVHAPTRPLADAVGLRSTHWLLYPVAALLGASLQVPADWLELVVTRVWPIPAADLEDQLQMLSMTSPLQRVMVPIVAVCVGPLVEELFYRGMMQTGLRRHTTSVTAVVTVAILFAAAHVTPQLLPVYAAVGAVLSILRATSGSVLPSLVAHMFFNAVAVVSLMVAGPSAALQSTPLPRAISILGTAAAVVLFALFIFIARRSERAQQARQEDAA